MRFQRSTFLGAACLAMVSAVCAQEDATAEADAAGIRAGDGAARWQPSIEFRSDTRTNFYYQSAGYEETGTSLVLTPKVRFVTGNDQHKFDALASASAATVSTSSKDGYVDGQLGLKHVWSPLNSFSLQTKVGAQHGHDPFGVNRTDAPALTLAGKVANANLDIWDLFDGSATLRFGRPEAIVNLETEFSANAKIYSSNKSLTQGLEYGQERGRFAGFLNYSDKTALVVEGIFENTHFYDSASASRDATEVRVRGGVRYQATGKTRADVRVGQFTRMSKTTGVADVDGVDYAASITWAPEEHYNFTVEAGRSSIPGYNSVGLTQVSFNDTDNVLVGWSQNWTDRFNTTLSAKYSYISFETPNGAGTRIDEIYEPGLRGSYEIGRHLFLTASAAYTDRQSDTPSAEYDAAQFQAGARYDFF